MAKEKVEYKTEPMTEEQYKHLMALLFYRTRIDVSGESENTLLPNAPYRAYLERCERTSIKEVKDE